MLTEKDLLQIKNKGISYETVVNQVENFKNGFPFLNIKEAATFGNGLFEIQDDNKFEELYNSEVNNYKVLKFVPASGAASRMFKDLFEFVDNYNDTEEDKSKFFGAPEKPIRKFFDNHSRFAFYYELDEKIKFATGLKMKEAVRENKYKDVLKQLLQDNAMNYGNLPKGLLKFHRYENKSRTPVEEHIVEAANYSCSDGKAFIHFTVSPEHMEGFKNHINSVLTEYSEKFKVQFDITYSIQKPSTDTIAVDENNEPFRNSDGSIIFRPGGHGALIENLNDIDADIVFIKNIDNVVPDRLKDVTFKYKKIIGGVLIYLKDKIFNFLKNLEKKSDKNLISEVEDFFLDELFFSFPPLYKNFSDLEKTKYLKMILNRPIRVCGMVKNEGEPGGGPFLAENHDGSVSLQVVEMSQIDSKNPEKQEIVKKATHFNPVDLVCYTKDYKGKKFDLRKFVDQQTGFISKKSKDGKELKAQELPGLWNGAMSDWNTLFIEVPIVTFNPVKEVNDLLRENHQ